MAIVRIGGAGVNLPTFPGLQNNTTGIGIPGQAGYYSGLTNTISLQPGETWAIPSGTWWVEPGPYTFLQWLDPVSNTYKVRPCAAQSTQFINSDGSNFRLANTTGCPTGAVITTATCTAAVNGIGSAINLVSCVASSGGSTWQTIVGGAVTQTLTSASSTNSNNAGSGYTYIPIVVIDAPPTGGLQATAVVTALTSGTILAGQIQIINQGAGYSVAPTMTVINDPRDTTGSGMVYTCSLTATGNLTGLYPINHGTALTGVPALTFALTNGANVSCAATAIMNFTVTSYASGVTVGSDVLAAELRTVSNLIAAQASPAVLNPLHTTGVTFPRPARIAVNIQGAVTQTTGSVIEDAGLGIQVVPTGIFLYSLSSTTGVEPQAGTINVGGTVDTSFIQPV